jgi:uncharacterized protein YjiS (DUF1127 family)
MTQETRNEAGKPEDCFRLSYHVVLKVAGNAIARIPAAILDWQNRTLQRRELLELSDWVLRDVGISRSAAEREGD